MEEDTSITKLLGIRKRIKKIYGFWYRLKKKMTPRTWFIILIIIILISAYLAFAYFEYVLHPQTLESISVDKTNPFFMAFFWLIGTMMAGYAEAPYSTVGRVLDLIVILIGIMTVATIISKITSRIVSANIGNMLGRGSTKKKIDYIICGWNPVSEAAYERMKKPGTEVVIIDKQGSAIPINDADVYFISGDPTEKDTLQKANIKNAKNIVLAMDEDSEVLLAIHVVRDLNPWINIVAKINDHEHVKLAEAAGADHVVSPPSIGGRLLSMATDEPAAVEWVVRTISIVGGIELVEYDVTNKSTLANKTIGEARKALKGTAKIIGMDTAEGFEKVPEDHLKIEPGNKLIMVTNKKIEEILK